MGWARIGALAWVLSWASATAQAAGGDAADARLEVLSGLVSADGASRARAARDAGWSGAPVFVEPLMARLADADPEVRAAAATALGDIGVPKSTTDLDAIIAALWKVADDAEAGVQQAALASLARFPFPAVRRRLVRRATTGPEDLQAAARAALAAAKPDEARARLDAYFELTRAEALRGPAALPPSEVRWGVSQGSLLAAARDLLSPVRALHWGATQNIASHPDQAARFPFLVHVLSELDPAVRRLAAGALAEQGDLRSARALETSLDDADGLVRAAAIAGVANREDAAAANLLVDRLARESDPKLLAAVGLALERQPEPAVLSALRRWPGDIDAKVGLRGVEIAGARTSTAAVVTLTRFVEVSTADIVAQRAAAHLAERPDRQVVPVVLPALEASRPGSSRRGRLIGLLWGRRHERLAPTLLGMLAEGHTDNAALDLLRAQPEAEVRPGVVALITHEDHVVRRSAIQVATNYVGADVLDASATAVDLDPDDDRAFGLLQRQAPTELLPVRLRLLADARHKRRHADLLRSLRDTRDPALPGPVASAAVARPELAARAIDLLELQPPAPAVEALAQLAQAPALRDPDRAAAVEALARVSKQPPQAEDRPLAPERVEAILRPLGKAEALEVRYAARNALHRLAPTRYPSWDPYGRIPLVVEGAAFGAGLMVMATQIAEADLSPAFVGGAGAVLGGATPFLLTLNEDVTLGDAGFFGTYGLWGTGAGLGLGLALDANRDDTLWLTVGGEVLGVTAGALALNAVEWGLDDVAFANFTALEASVLSAGLTALILDGDARRNEVALGAGLLGGAASLVPLAIFTRDAQLEGKLGILSTSMLHGAWLGAIAPGIFFSDGLDAGRIGVGAAVGQSAGYLAGLALARYGGVRADSAGWSFFGAVVGGAALGGLGYRLEGADSRLRYGLLEAGAAAGALTLGLVGPELDFRENDIWLVTLLAGIGGLAGADLSVRIEEETLGEPGLRAGVIMGAGFGAAAGLVASQLVDVSDKTLLTTVMGGGLGVGMGSGLGSMLPNLGVRDRSKISGAFAVAGAALALPWAENLEVSGRTIGYSAASAGVLGGLMALTPYHYNDGAPPGGQVAGGVLFGSVLGGYAGFAAAQALKLELEQTGKVTLASIAAAGFGGGLGLVVPSADPSVAAGLAQGLGLATFAAASGFAASGLWRGASRPRVGGAAGSAARMSSLGLHGALHGALIGLTWRADADDVTGREVGGGMMLGTSAGILLGLGARGLGAPRLQPEDLVEVSLLTTSAYALAGGAGLLAEDRRLGLSLFHGLGLAAYGTSWAFAPRTEYDAATPWTLSLGIGLGSWLGGWSSRVFVDDPSRAQVAGGMLAGAGLGAAAGAVWSQLQDDRHEGEVALDSAFGAALGAGLALAVDASGRASGAAVQAGTALGLGVGVALAPRTTFSAGDQGLVGVATTLGAVHGAFVPTVFDEADSGRRAGAALIGAAAGYTAGSIAAQLTALDPKEVVELSLLTAGMQTFGGGLSLSVSAFDGSTRAAIFHLAGGAGVALGALVAPRTRYALDDASYIGLTGLFGGFIGGFVPSAWEDPSGRSVTGGVMMGASAGTLAGVLLSQTYRLDVGDQLEAALGGLVGAGVGGGLVSMLDVEGRGVAPYVAGGAALGVAAGIAAAPHTAYTTRDRGLLAYTTGMGAWHGLWLAGLRDDRSASGRAAGAMFGVGAGWVAGAVASQFSEVAPSALLEGSLSWAIGAGLGAGVGLLSPDISGRGTVGLMEGLGATGAIAGLVFSDALEFEGGDYALVPAGTLFGAALGLTLPTFVSDGAADAETRGGGVLLGASAGVLVAGTVAQFTAVDFDDVLEASLVSLFSQGFGLGLGLSVPDSTETLRFALLDGFGVAGLGVGLALSRFTELDDDSAMTLALGAMLGGGLGTLSPAYWNDGGLANVPSEQFGGASLLGTTLGVGTAFVLDQAFDLSPTTRNHAATGAALGALTGAGFGLVFSEDDRVAVGLTQGLAIAGGAAVGATLADFDYDKGDLALGSAYVGYLTWHSMGLTLLLDGTDRQAAGVAVGTVGLGALTGMYLAPYIDMTLSDTLMLLAGNVWGTWIGGWGGALLADAVDSDLDGRRKVGLALLSSVLGSDLGLTVTGLVVGEILDVPPTRFAYINLGGLSGMLVGMLGAGFAKGEPLKAGNVIGSLSGLVLGSVITSFFDWSSSPTWDELLSKRRPVAAPGVAKADLPSPKGPTGFGVQQWMPSAQVVPSPEGDPQYMFTVSGILR